MLRWFPVSYQEQDNLGHFLAMDLGGTKIEVAVAAINNGELDSLHTIKLATEDYQDFNRVLMASCEQLGRLDPQGVTGVAVAVAGPVVDGAAQLTNIPWSVSEAQLRKFFPAARIALMNDMQAHGYAAIGLMAAERGKVLPSELQAEYSTLMDAPARVDGSACVIAPGTGLGEGLIVWTGDRHLPVASEGGHCSFAPINEEQMELLTFLRTEQGHHHVSWERIVSGKFGLPNLYLFVTRKLGRKSTVAGLEAEILDGHQPVQALMAAADDGDPVADKVLELFMSLMGQEAGNLALKVMATGGVYISGGLSQRMKSALKGKYLEAFREGMCSKGRFRKILSGLPVIFLEDRDTAIKGAMASVLL